MKLITFIGFILISLLSVSLPASARIAYTYDVLGRATLTNYPGATPDITYAYDANSNVTRTVRGGTIWDYGYNSGDMLTSETLSIDGRSYQGLNSYNADGHLMIRTTPGGRTIDYQVNGLGQPTAASIGGFAYASGVTYHANGALASANYGNGQVRTNTQNARQLLSGINITNGSTIALGLSYTHDANGRITDMDDTHSGGLQRRYQYDLLGRLVYAWCGWGTSDYTYDALGNMRLYEVDDFRHNRHIVQDYTYDARNRMASTTYEAGITETYNFDSYGRITIGHNRTTHYDFAHRPTSVVHNNGRTDSFIYDGNLHRAKETIFHKTQYSVYGQGGTLLFRDNITDGETTDYVRLGGHTIARLKTDSAGVTTVIYPHTNHLGSPVAATDANGDLLWREEYTPFGRKHENAPGQRGEEGFTGHIFDGQNTVHMKARTYMTTSYRFTTPDPVTFLSSGLDPAYFNRYAYVGNDPVNAIDPDGECARDADGNAVSGVCGTDQASQDLLDRTAANSPETAEADQLAQDAGELIWFTYNPDQTGGYFDRDLGLASVGNESQPIAAENSETGQQIAYRNGAEELTAHEVGGHVRDRLTGTAPNEDNALAAENNYRRNTGNPVRRRDYDAEPPIVVTPKGPVVYDEDDF